ncbi:hypothetical protein MK280_17020 [Myxococcota bacterium]|nr:hypothetical protein [Myxococcota bacterium]
MPIKNFDIENPGPTELSLALCHEVGNLVGAIRLHTHMIDEDMTPRDLAHVTLEVDGLCARSATLLSHLSPLLSEPRAPSSVDPDELIASVRDVVVEQGGRNVQIAELSLTSPRLMQGDREVLHRLLQSLLFATLDLTRSGDSVTLGVESASDTIALTVEDEAPVREDPCDWRLQVKRGRPLLLAVAHEVLASVGGRLQVSREESRTRVAFILPRFEATD